MSIQRKLVAWMEDRIGTLEYSQDMWARANTDISKKADCSSLVQKAYRDVAGIEVGSWTGDQQNFGRRIFGAGTDYATAISLLKPSDLIFFDWYGNAPTTFHHVEMIRLDVTQTIGHGGDPHWGPVTKSLLRQWNAAHSISARRYISDDFVPVTPPPGAPSGDLTNLPVLPLPDYSLPDGSFYGLITGPANSHGGFYVWEQPIVKALQQRLIVLGHVPGVTNPWSGWADGLYEQATFDAVVRFQKASHIRPTGQIDRNTYYALRAQTPRS